MNKLANDWLDVAKVDIDTARTMLDKTDDMFLNVAAYHCQQAAEKMIKSVYIENKIEFLRIHDILLLINNLEACGADVAVFDVFLADGALLTLWEEKSRYIISPVASRQNIERLLALVQVVWDKLRIDEVDKTKKCNLEEDFKSLQTKPRCVL